MSDALDEREARILRVEAKLQERTQALNDREADLRKLQQKLEEARRTKTPPSIIIERERLAAHAETLAQLQQALMALQASLNQQRYDLNLFESQLISREHAVTETERARAKKAKRKRKAP